MTQSHHHGQNRQAISARRAPSQPSTCHAHPIKKHRPRPTKQGRGRDLSVDSLFEEHYAHSNYTSVTI